MSRPSAATILAGLALFVALSGTSYAVSKLPKNSVGAEQVRDGSLTAADLAAGAAGSGPRGPRGAQGPAGAAGGAGPAGPAGVVKAWMNRTDANIPLPYSANGAATTVASLRLPAGTYALDFTGHPWMSTGGGQLFVDCALSAPGQPINTTATVLGPSPQPAQEANMAISDVATFSQAVTVTVSCSMRNASYDVRMATPRLRALAVSSVEVQ